MNTENSKTNETHKFVLNLLQRLETRSSNKHVAVQTLSICYIRKNIRKLYENNKQKIIAPTGNDELELPNVYFMSDVQDYIQYIIKKDERLTTISPIYVYINKINNIKWI